MKIVLRKVGIDEGHLPAYLYWDADEDDCIGRDYCILTRGDVIGYTNNNPFPETEKYKLADMIFDLCTYKGTFITQCARHQAEYIRDFIGAAMEGRIKQ